MPGLHGVDVGPRHFQSRLKPGAKVQFQTLHWVDTVTGPPPAGSAASPVPLPESGSHHSGPGVCLNKLVATWPLRYWTWPSKPKAFAPLGDLGKLPPWRGKGP